MNSNVSAFAPDWASPPGDTIQDLMEERDWNQAELAQRLGSSAKHINQLIKGKVPLSYDMALKLERVLGSTLNFWMNRETNYREHIARLEAKSKYEEWCDWLDSLPLVDLKKIGLIENKNITSSRKPEIVQQLLSFFGVASPDDWENYYASMQGSFRRSNRNEASVGAIATWLRLGELQAEESTVPKYKKSKFERAVFQIRELTTLSSDEFMPKMIELCADAGVKLVLVPSITKAHVSGVARWLNGHSPLIQLSLYGKMNDKFWFTFFHEVAHILLHSEEKKSIFLDDINLDQYSPQEIEANEWSKEMLIPDKYRYDICSLRSRDEILSFSREINVHPGIVVGRLQHDKIISHATNLNGLKEALTIG